MKTTVKSISFTRPFQLAGMAKPHPAGTFDLRIDEEPIERDVGSLSSDDDAYFEIEWSHRGLAYIRRRSGKGAGR